MAVGAVFKMRACIDKCIRMTGSTVVRIGRRYDRAVIRGRCMNVPPDRTVTRRTVAAIREGLAARTVGRYQTTITIMTRCTGVMNLRIAGIGQRRRISVAVGTVGRCYLD